MVNHYPICGCISCGVVPNISSDSYPSAFAARSFHGTLTCDGRNFLDGTFTLVTALCDRRDCLFTVKMEDPVGIQPTTYGSKPYMICVSPKVRKVEGQRGV